MRIFSSCMRRFKELEDRIDALGQLPVQELLKRAVKLERRTFDLENILAKVRSSSTTDSNLKQMFFNHNKYKRRHVALQFAYLGWEYGGLAIQNQYHSATVMGKVLEALQKCKLIESIDTCTFAVCGRTDKGVSALSQVLSVVLRSALTSGYGVIENSGPEIDQRLDKRDSEMDYVFMLNRVLPHDIRMLAWSPVDPEFNARFTCSQRSYTYYFPFSGLDLQTMNAAGKRLEGVHDFRNFCSNRVEKDCVTFVRRIDEVVVAPIHSVDNCLPTTLCSLSVSASGFLYHQIRCIVSLLIMIGRGYEPPHLIDDLLDIEKTPAKPQYQMAGDLPLILKNVQYPENSVNWQTSPEAQLDLIKHFQNLSTDYSIRSATLETFLEHVENRFPQASTPLTHLDRIVPEGRWRPEAADKAHRPISKRPLERSIEERIEQFKRKKEASTLSFEPSDVENTTYM